MTPTRTLVLSAVLLAGGYAAWHFTRPRDTPTAEATPVPVSTAVAKQESVPVYLRTIGNVRALNAVEIRPQVGGVLLDVRSRRGAKSRRARCSR